MGVGLCESSGEVCLLTAFPRCPPADLTGTSAENRAAPAAAAAAAAVVAQCCVHWLI